VKTRIGKAEGEIPEENNLFPKKGEREEHLLGSPKSRKLLQRRTKDGNAEARNAGSMPPVQERFKSRLRHKHFTVRQSERRSRKRKREELTRGGGFYFEMEGTLQSQQLKHKTRGGVFANNPLTSFEHVSAVMKFTGDITEG